MQYLIIYFLLGYVYDGLPQYPQPHRIIGFCNYMPRIMNNTDLCPGSGLHPDGSYVTEELLTVITSSYYLQLPNNIMFELRHLRDIPTNIDV